MITYSLLHPSRMRPEMAFKTYRNWISKAKDKSRIEYILSLDADDPQMLRYYTLFNDYPVVKIVNRNKNVVQATNQAAEVCTNDILIYVSDDFDCPEHWDELLDKVIANRNPQLEPFAIEVNDCYQTNRNLLTIPIISRAMYQAERHFWHPQFASMFCDNWIWERARRAYTLIDAYHLKFPHLHYSLGHYAMDETNKRSNNNWNEGKRVFNQLAQKYGYNVKY